jgi:hypothetical protein
MRQNSAAAITTASATTINMRLRLENTVEFIERFPFNESEV